MPKKTPPLPGSNAQINGNTTQEINHFSKTKKFQANTAQPYKEKSKKKHVYHSITNLDKCDQREFRPNNPKQIVT
jgi:hypothetical protein